MKQFTFLKNSALLVVMGMWLVACEGVWVQDPIDPRMPKYTEKGNDVAGAFVNDRVWKSCVVRGVFSQSDMPYVYSSPNDESIIFVFEGDVDNDQAYIQFHLSGYKIDSLRHLLLLGGQTIVLDGDKNTGYFYDDFSPERFEYKGVGQIYFRHASCQDYGKVILSGTFGFSFLNSQNELVEVKSGRFDFKFFDQTNFSAETEYPASEYGLYY